MDQLRRSMESSSANSMVDRREAWKRKEPMPRTRSERDMKSALGSSIPRLLGPYMDRRARKTRGDVSHFGTRFEKHNLRQTYHRRGWTLN